MLKLLYLLLALSFRIFAQSTAGGIIDGPLAKALSATPIGSYTTYYTLTTDHTQAGTVDSTNYPILVYISRTGLKTISNGGDLSNSLGYDHIYTSTLPVLSGGRYVCSPSLAWESVIYTPSTGQIQDFVRLPTLHSGSNDVFYMCAGNPSITTFQGNTNATWTAYVGPGNKGQVLHLTEVSNPYADSTGNGFGSNGGTYPTQVAGLFGNAQSFLASSSQYISTPTPLPSGGANLSASTHWVKISTIPGSNMAIWDDRITQGTGYVDYIDTSGHPNGYCNNSGTLTGSVSIADGNWHYLAMTYNVGTFTFYVDSSLIGSNSGCSFQTSLVDLYLGHFYNGGGYLTAVLEESRTASGTILSSSWFTADYNSQQSGSTFLTVVP